MWGYPEFYIPVPGGYGTESAMVIYSGTLVRTMRSPSRSQRNRLLRP